MTLQPNEPLNGIGIGAHVCPLSTGGINCFTPNLSNDASTSNVSELFLERVDRFIPDAIRSSLVSVQMCKKVGKVVSLVTTDPLLVLKAESVWIAESGVHVLNENDVPLSSVGVMRL